MDIMEKPKKKKAIQQAVDGMENFAELARQGRSDVLGSYTGVPLSPEDDVPEQDADDL